MPTLQKSSQLPKYSQIAEELRAKIRSGSLEPGTRLPSVAQMKERHGVSLATVDRAQALLEQEGYIVREHGRGAFVAGPQRRKKTGIIGYVGNSLARECQVPYAAHLMEGIEERAQGRKKRILLLCEDSPLGWDRVDGVLLYIGSDPVPLPRWLPAGVPCVSVVASAEAAPAVKADDRDGARQAVEYLLSLGHRRIACLMQDDSLLPRLRLDGYREALRNAGIHPSVDWIRSPRFWDTVPASEFGRAYAHYRLQGYESMRQWLRDGWRESDCTAVLAQNDYVAIGVVQALREAGIGVPEEVSVVGFDGTEVCELVTPTLTSVQVPLREIGSTALEMLLTLIENHEVEAADQMLPTRLIVRASTAPPPAKHKNARGIRSHSLVKATLVS